jgi:pimeloyl-ACP methyl ester carboxylesterase
MIPFHFGPPERRLFGAFHPGLQRTRVGVLLCNPFGQEAIRIHRSFRVLAERLSRAGVDVLRFDPYGTGDSAGADEEGDFDGWCRDVQVAHDELVRRSGATRVTWLGARLGAAVAHRAASNKPANLRGLVLWDPVLDGSTYLELLRVKHVEALEASYGMVDPAWREQLAADPTAFENESMGFAISANLRTQLRAVVPDSAPVLDSIAIGVVADPADPVVQGWVESRQLKKEQVRFFPAHDKFDWTAEEAMNTALVPAQTLQQLVNTLTSLHE